MAERSEAAADQELREKRGVRLRRIEWAKEHHGIKAEPKGLAKIKPGSRNPAGVMEEVNERKRTADFGRTRPDHATGVKSAQRRWSADDYGKAKMAMEARGRRDEFAAEQAIEEDRDLVIPEEQAPLEDEAEAARRSMEGSDEYEQERAGWKKELDDPTTTLERQEELREFIRSNDEEEAACLVQDKHDIEMVRLEGVQRVSMTERQKPSHGRGSARAKRFVGS